jgi:hypothetical protein
MRSKYVQLAGALVVLLVGGAGYTWAGLVAYGAYRSANATYAAPCGAYITWTPPTQLYTAFYANSPALVHLRYRSVAPQTLRVTVSVPQLTEEQSVELQAEPAFQAYDFKPPLLGTAALDALVGLRQRQGQIRLRVQAGNQALCDTSAPVTLYSRQVMRWYDPSSGDLSDYLAGWVTPQADVIRDLVGHAANWLEQHPSTYTGVAALNGYDSGRASAGQVRNQIDAIFDTLQFVYHVHYAQDNVPYNHDATQFIQLPQDVLTSAVPTAMCVETTAILASAVERLGMRPFIVIVPGHAFLGVALSDDPHASIEYWETSDLNGGVLGSQANVHGDAEYAENQTQKHVLRVVDIIAERELGIEPIE